jgi:UDP-N-acetylmuramate dehydrogenase
MQHIHDAAVPWFVTGRGSNLLVRDGGIRGVVLSLERLNGIRFMGHRLTAEAGCSFVRVAVLAAQQGLGGLEFAGGIPGSVGGAVFMNAGAHGSDVSQVLEAVTVLTEKGPVRMTREQMGFAYRTSRLQKEPGIVMEAVFRLNPSDRAEITEKMRQYRLKRLTTQPLNLPCAGSVFRNPPGDYAARLIEAAGLKGMTVGGAQISPLHANFIVNTGHATANDILALIAYCQEVVREKFGIQLHAEVRIAGED